MAFEKKDQHDFYGKEVTDAIKEACAAFAVPQEKLDIELVSAGSAGIFGFIRKKAHIRATLKAEELKQDTSVTVAKQKHSASHEFARNPDAPVQEISADTLALIERETQKIVDLMGFVATVSATAKCGVASCVITTDFEKELTGQDGKTLDSIQYVVRKIVVKHVEDRLRINLDVNDFRSRRLEELKLRALEYSRRVKEDGKTQVITSLNPSERRAIHMVLQEDKEIRSRSIGDGLFKKILIYKPGNGSRGGRKRGGSSQRNAGSGSTSAS